MRDKEAAVKAKDGRGDKDKGASDMCDITPSEDVSPMEAAASRGDGTRKVDVAAMTDGGEGG